MINASFVICVFQNRKLTDEVETGVHQFKDVQELAHEMAGFAAMNHQSRLQPELRGMLHTKINIPPVKDGLGPETYALIKHVNVLT